MARLKTILQSHFPYHVCARSHNKDRFSIPTADVWRIASRELYFLSKAYGIKIHSFVLMDNHFHLLMTTPDSNIDKAMWHFMTYVSRQVNEQAGEINQVFGARYFKCVIESYHYFLHAYKYVYRNPVHAGLSRTCESYPYSTIHGLLGQAPMLIPVEEDTLLFPEINSTMDWLNRTPDPERWEQVGRALKKKKFSFERNNRYNSHSLNVDML